MSITTSRITTNKLVEQEVASKINILQDIGNKVYDAMSDRQLVGINFLLNDNVQQILDDSIHASGAEYEKLRFEIEKMLQNYKYLLGTDALFLYAADGRVYTNKRYHQYRLDDLLYSTWFQAGVMEDKSYFWGDPDITPQTITVPLVRVIREIRGSRNLGYLISTIHETYFADLYEIFLEETVSEFCIVNERGIIISHNRKDLIGTNINGLISGITTQRGYEYVTLPEGRSLVTYFTDPRNQWTYINIVPWQEMYRGARDIQQFTLMLSLLLIAVCFCIAYVLSRGIIRPINSLITRMERAKKGDWNVTVQTEKQDEIGRLENSFDVMIQELKRAFEETVAVQRQKRKAELTVLEYQINPHFLYNTMSAIIWLSDKKDHESVIRVASSLSELFRISISKGKEVLSIADEITYVQHYLEIQRVRYPDEFDLKVDVSDEVLQGYTIKLILQPLVENAIYHGIKPGGSREVPGLLTLTGRLAQGDVVFQVIDNAGMLSEEEADRLNVFLQEHRQGDASNYGIGIRNVHDRIQLAYGKEYGISFKRSETETIVTVRIPYRTEKED